jgi:PTS system glucitol/sorbitol-specific IIA component
MSDAATTADAGVVVYQTTIIAVGDQVAAFVDAGILILFAAGAPAELHDISVLHDVEIQVSGPQAVDTVQIGDTAFPVLAAGHVVEENLLNLGHVAFKADGRGEAKLPGDVCVPTGSIVLPQVGQQLRIRRQVKAD